MVVKLDGGAIVSAMREGAPEECGALKIWHRAGRSHGALAISLRILELQGARSPALGNERADEVLYVMSGRGKAWLGEQLYPLSECVALYVPPGIPLTLEAEPDYTLVIASSRCPDPGYDQRTPAGRGPIQPIEPSPRVALRDRSARAAGSRWYKVMSGPEEGSEKITQFVGAVPQGHEPDHFHLYEEALVILSGRGRLWVGKTNTELSEGSCIYLPKRQMHRVENTGEGELLLLGVMYPAGSPSVRYGD